MAPSTPSKTAVGGRKLVERFAAHLAFVLNTGKDGVVDVQAFKLFTHITALLTGRGNTGNIYRDGLLAFGLAAADRTADELAVAYFDRVLDRGMFLARDNHLHIAHEMFTLLCRRGALAGWDAVEVARGSPAKVGERVPPDFPRVTERLSRLKSTISAGNPAASTRAAHGPITLSADGARSAEVAEEMSVWGAIASSPDRQKVQHQGAEFDRLCSIVIKAVEAANAHYGALVRLGLPPLEWMDDVSVNTAKSLSSFIADVKAATGGPLEDLPTWKTTWERRKVPGYKTVDDLWNSEVGRFIRRPVIPKAVEVVDVTGPFEPSIGSEDDSSLLDGDLAIELAESAHKVGAISDLEVWLFEQVCNEQDLDDIRRSQRWRRDGGPGSIEEIVDALRIKLLRWAAEQQRGT